jgi:hypothetical protein
LLKTSEIENPASCLNKAKPFEMLFVLLGRDAAAPVAIRAWIRPAERDTVIKVSTINLGSGK